jgi:hypothetical protein
MSTGIHIPWNFTQGAVLGYPVSGDVENVSLLSSIATGPIDLTGGAHGPEAGYLGAIAMLLGAVLIVVCVAMRTGRVRILAEIAEYRPLSR